MYKIYCTVFTLWPSHRRIVYTCCDLVTYAAKFEQAGSVVKFRVAYYLAKYDYALQSLQLGIISVIN